MRRAAALAIARRGCSSGAEGKAAEWLRLQALGVKLNPCGSSAHPAVAAGVVPPPPPDAPLISMQEAYDPRSICFACGPSSETGLRLQSFRAVEGGLVGEVRVPEQYVELPGVVSSGILSALAACHANWASSIALMDRAVLARPPLLQTSRIALEYARDCSAAPGQLLRITSRVLAIADAVEPFTVDVAVRLATAEGEELATGTASFVKIGAARSL